MTVCEIGWMAGALSFFLLGMSVAFLIAFILVFWSELRRG